MRNWMNSVLLMLMAYVSHAQVFPEGIPFQAQVFSQAGGILSNATIGVRFNIRTTSMTGPIAWQENHTITVNDLGHFAAIVGSGTSTGAGIYLAFPDIDWADDTYFLELLIDETLTGSYVSVMTQQMMAVPFAYHSKTTSQQFALSQLQDVDTTGIQVGDLLKWNGTSWIASPDDLATLCDTVIYAYSSDSANYADTAGYAANCVTIMYVDTAEYAFQADSAVFAQDANAAEYADSAGYAGTAGVALYATGNWSLTGNGATTPATNFLGTTDSVDLVFKAYNVEKFRIKANGRMGFGTTNPLTDFHVTNTNGVLFTGTHGTGALPATGTGTRMMWYPKKSAFRAGYVVGVNWDDVNVGDYSFATGYNTRASGLYSAAFGNATIASGEGSFAVGNQSIASGLYAFAAGHNPIAAGDYTIALGRGAVANGYGSIAIGYHPQSDAAYGLALGNYTYVAAPNGVAVGYHSHVLHAGSFVYSDESSPLGYTYSTAANQFLVKASGGFIFYTNSALTTGVTLPAGAGAWSTLSDRNSKENIQAIDPLDYLNRLDNIEVFEWNYISQDSSIRHIGPMAQDFYATFNIGTDPTKINSGDFDGVNLILLKALNMRMTELQNQQERIDLLNTELEYLRTERQKMMEMLIILEQRVAATESTAEKAQPE